MAEKQTVKFYIISKFPVGSGIKNDAPVRKIELSTEDEDFKEFDDFDEYVKESLDNECADDEQHWANCVVLTEEEFDLVQSFKK